MLNDHRQLVNANGYADALAGLSGLSGRNGLSVVVNGLNSVNMSAPHSTSTSASATSSALLPATGNGTVVGAPKCTCNTSRAGECGRIGTVVVDSVVARNCAVVLAYIEKLFIVLCFASLLKILQ